MELAIETNALSRRFGDVVAVDAVDLAVPRGSLYGFLGPNGAGKSTTIKCLTGLLRPSSGSVEILGLDPRADSLAVKRQIGVIPEEQALFDRLTAVETLSFVGQVHGLDRATIQSRSEQLFDLLALRADAGRLVADYSHGMRKKLALAVAVLPAPRLLFLDEPFEGIDAVASRQIKEMLHEFVARGGTVFLTSHILEIIERLADHIGVIHRGRLVAQGPLAALRSGGGGQTLEEVFLDLVGASATERPPLEWLA